MVTANERLHAADPTHALTTPNRGASAAQLEAAEQRIGRRLPAQYRQLLGIADGWDDYFRGSSLFGTEDLGQGPRWQDAHSSVQCAFSVSNGALAASLGVDDDPSNCLPVSWGESGWHSCIVLFINNARGARAGEAFLIGDGAPRAADLYTRLYDELLANIDDVVRAEHGPHSAAWGRDIRADPPSTEEILDVIRRLTSQLGLASWSRAVRPAATPAALDGLAEALGGGLHPDHRDLLAHTDGLELVQRAAVSAEAIPYLNVLSVDDILKGDRWAQTLAAEQRFHDAWADEMTSVPANSRTSVLELVTAEQLVPFGTDVGPIGLDPVDGQLRWLRDNLTRLPERRQSVREMLLDHCDHLHAQLSEN